MSFKRNIFFVALIAICVCFTTGFTFFKNVNSISQNVSKTKNELWCVTFQLVWNEFMDKYSDGKPIIFEGRTPKTAKQLNKKLYTKEILDSKSYYLAQGEISLDLKKEIETAIKNKFNETSDVLDFINWGAKNSYLFYAMLKKDFTYPNEFKKLDAAYFNSSKEKVKYFGVEAGASSKMRNGVDVMFYNSPNEYAVKLKTNQGEDVILLRTKKKGDFEKLYSYVVDNTDFGTFNRKDTLKVPEINVDEVISYDDLTGKKLKDKNQVITQALQTIKFKLDNKGGSLKSEAVISVMTTSLQPVVEPRNFTFDKPFVLFLKETAADKPYYAMKIENTKYLVKE